MFSIYIINVYIRGVWGAVAPQKPTTHYKKKKNGDFSFIVSQDIFFSFSQARPGYFFLLFSETNYFFLLSSDQVIFFFQNQRQEFFFGNNPAPPPPTQNIKWSAPYKAKLQLKRIYVAIIRVLFRVHNPTSFKQTHVHVSFCPIRNSALYICEKERRGIGCYHEG